MRGPSTISPLPITIEPQTGVRRVVIFASGHTSRPIRQARKRRRRLGFARINDGRRGGHDRIHDDRLALVVQEGILDDCEVTTRSLGPIDGCAPIRSGRFYRRNVESLRKQVSASRRVHLTKKNTFDPPTRQSQSPTRARSSRPLTTPRSWPTVLPPLPVTVP